MASSVPTQSYRAAMPAKRPPDRRLAVARAAWVVVALVTLGLFLTAIPLRYAQLQNVCSGVACSEMQLSPDDVRVLQALGLDRSAYAAYNLGLEVIFAAVSFIVAGIVFTRRSDDYSALFVSMTLITFGAVVFAGTMNALVPRPWAWRLPISLVSRLPDVLPGWLAPSDSAWWLPVSMLSAIGQASAIVFFYVFPSGRFVPRWTVALVPVWIAWQVPAIFFPDSRLNPSTWPPVLSAGSWGLFLGSCAYAQLYRFFRVSGAAERQQTKWVVYGIILALGGILTATVLSWMFSYRGLDDLRYRTIVNTALYLAMVALPLSIGVAITRSRLWDIGVIVNRTLVYGLLSGTLALIYFGLIILLQLFVRPWLGPGRDETLVAISTLAAAALFTPVKQRAQGLIDRRFFRSKYDAAHTLAEFSARLRGEVDLERLSADLTAVVEQAMQPSRVALWLRPSQRSEPLE